MLKASPDCNVVLVKGDSGGDVNLVGIDDAAGSNVIRVQASAGCVLHRRIRACDVILIEAGATGDVQDGMVFSG